MAALVMTALIGCATLTVDLGSLSHERRALQLSNDAAAMAAVVPILQMQSNQAAPDTTRLTSIVSSALTSNGYANAVVDSVVAGTYCPDPSLTASARFTPGISTCANTVYDGPVPNAVQTTVHVQSPFYFAGALGSSSAGQGIAVSSVAVGIDEGAFTIGAGMISASTANAPLINGVLGGMLGSSISLSAANYDGLSNTPLDALSTLSAMATSPAVNAATIGGLSGASAGLGTPLQSEISALTASGTSGTASSNALQGLQMLSAGVYGQPQVQLGQLVNPIAYANVAPGATRPIGPLSAAVNSFQMASGAIQMANNGASITIPTASLNLAGLSGLTVTATTAPAASGFPGDGLGYVGTSAGTSQITMQVGMQITPAAINSMGSTAVSSLSMPTTATIASGSAQLTGVSCGANPSTDATLTVTGATGAATIDTTLVAQVTITPFGGSATTINVSTPVTVQVSSSALTSVTFAQSDISGQTSKRISSSDSLTNVNANLASSLASQTNASINSQASGLVLPPGFMSQLNSEISDALSNTLAPLLDTVITNVAAAVGAQVGYMDVTGTGVRCGIPAIAN